MRKLAMLGGVAAVLMLTLARAASAATQVDPNTQKAADKAKAKALKLIKKTTSKYNQLQAQYEKAAAKHPGAPALEDVQRHLDSAKRGLDRANADMAKGNSYYSDGKWYLAYASYVGADLTADFAYSYDLPEARGYLKEVK